MCRSYWVVYNGQAEFNELLQVITGFLKTPVTGNYMLDCNQKPTIGLSLATVSRDYDTRQLLSTFSTPTPNEISTYQEYWKPHPVPSAKIRVNRFSGEKEESL